VCSWIKAVFQKRKKEGTMKISIFGMGYVGCVTAACLSKAGHTVLGIDVNKEKIDMINESRSPIVEKGLEELIAQGVKDGRLRGIGNPREGVFKSDVSIVCVGTPSQANGNLDLTAVGEVSRQIGKALAEKPQRHCVVIRSTVLPGTTRNVIIPILNQESGRVAGKDFDVCFNPEFLREGNSIWDFYHPPFTVIGQQHEETGTLLEEMYEFVDAPLKRTSFETAEMVKYSCNNFHAVKVAFANEIGVICKSYGIDSHAVMDLFVMDEKLNISKAYLKPGFAFGGSCLPKDIRALLYAAKASDLQVPLLHATFESNKVHIDRAIRLVLGKGKKKIGILGLSFKEGTDDLRESPMVVLVETLIGKGCEIKIYDQDVMLAKLFGANKQFIEKEIPHISSLMCNNLAQVLEESDVVVLGKKEGGFKEAIFALNGSKPVIDLVRAFSKPPFPEQYEGLCW
jgi:GDP-mannose 6-dehydrogenase